MHTKLLIISASCVMAMGCFQAARAPYQRGFQPPAYWQRGPEGTQDAAVQSAVDRELSRNVNQLYGAALMRGREPERAAQIEGQVAREIQMRLELQLRYEDALARVHSAVDQLTHDPRIQESLRAQERMDVGRASIAARVNPALARANRQQQEAQADEVRQRLFGKAGSLRALAAANPALPEVTRKMLANKPVDLSQLPALYVKGYQGQPSEVTELLRAELYRTEGALAIAPWQRYGKDAQQLSRYFFLQFTVDSALTLAQQNPRDPASASFAYETVLAYRARRSEVDRRISAALSEQASPQARELRSELIALRGAISKLEMKRALGVPFSPGESEQLARDKASAARILDEIDNLVALSRAQDRPFEVRTSMQQLVASIPEQQAVVSFVEFRHAAPAQLEDPSQWPRWYGAFVRTKAALTFVPLASASELETDINAFLHTIAAADQPLSAKYQVARVLHDKTLGKLGAALASVRELRVVSDGMLQLIPLEALYDGQSFMADRYHISYANSERQLAGEHNVRAEAGAALVLLGGPYEETPQPFEPRQALSARHFPRLVHAESEAVSVQRTLPKAQLLRAREANEAALSGAPPRVLHIAAHGIYLPLQAREGAADRGLVFRPKSAADAAPVHSEPRVDYRKPPEDSETLSRAALVLAPDVTGSDGFLSAYEVAARDLWGTQLVVLSACETGRGEPDRARGVGGLRTAFFTAGAESLVVSLWSVDDQATSELMQTFYSELARGQSRQEALSLASAAVRKKNKDPYVWAPFVLLGATTPLRP
ncbi:MAG: hypothetical protein JWN48_2389 [Myxococcaceae bacterium]|nr:hypothetical protein [Myxococcaceae bacterium]